MFVFGFIAALIVALAFSSVSAKWFGKSGVQFAPNETNANDCSADEKCVIQNAIVQKSVEAPIANLVSMQGSSLKMIDLSNPYDVHASRLNTKTLELAKFMYPQDRISFSGPTISQAKYSYDGLEFINSPFNMARSTYNAGEILGYLRSSPVGQEENVFALSSNAISSKYLAGNGTAYACIDSTGKLFRSKNPCR